MARLLTPASLGARLFRHRIVSAIRAHGPVFILGVAATYGLALALYLPFLDSQLVFDDANFFYQWSLAKSAVTPIDMLPRTFPYFTFAFIQTITQSFEVQRVFNAVLHGANAWLLFFVVQRLLSTYKSKESVIPAALLVAVMFACHPVAVYGVAYLVQRTILFATFFSLLALLCYFRAITENRWPSLLLSALWCSAAIMSKEHAVALPFAVVSLTAVIRPSINRQTLFKALAFLALSLPVIFLVVYVRLELVGTVYEPHAALFTVAGSHPWLTSIMLECRLMFSYLHLWLLPDTALMSADLRPTMPVLPIDALWVFVFLLMPTLGLLLILKSRQYKIAGFGLLYSWILFLVELSTVRLQEPFVLYRSYLWAPGFLFIAADFARRLPFRAIVIVFFLIVPLLFYQSIDRLNSLSTSMRLWDDAVKKLPTTVPPSAFRIFYNRGLNYLSANTLDLALADMNRAIELNPLFYGSYHGRSIVRYRQKHFDLAMMDIDRALSLAPSNPSVLEKKGAILEAMGDLKGAAQVYAIVDKTGSLVGIFRRSKANQQVGGE